MENPAKDQFPEALEHYYITSFGQRPWQHSLFSPMNKQALAEMIHEKIGGTKVQSEEVVQMIIDAIISTLKKGDEVSLAGLGIFSAKARPARMARNPKTGEQVKVAATTVPKFRAAKAFKDAVK